MRRSSRSLGVVFSAYRQGGLNELARGGRYDDVGADFGRARPATGFSCDLRQLVSLTEQTDSKPLGILAPDNSDPSLWQAVTALREQGERVVVAFNPEDSAADLGCDRELLLHDGVWQTQKI